MIETKIFLATTGRGVVRAEPGPNSKWEIESYMEDKQVVCLATDPLNKQIIYAGTQHDGAWRSEDRGKTWQPAGLSGNAVKALAASPHQPGLLYAGTKPACVFISHDQGRNWQELESFRHIRGRRFWRSPAEPPDWQAYVQGLVLSPTDPNVILAGIEFGAVVRSQDGGRTWSNHRKGALRDCHSLAFHTSDGDWVYEAGGSGGGQAFSRDSGRTWQKLKKGLDRRYGWACAADPAQPDIWYVSASAPFSFPHLVPAAHVDGQANAAIYRSAAGGPWEKIENGLPQPLDYMAYALLTDPSAPGHLVAGLSNGDIYHSTDYGDSFHKLPLTLGAIQRSLIMA